MINVHCITHTLALATAQFSSEVVYLKKLKTIMQNLFQFYHNSAVRIAGLHEIQRKMSGGYLITMSLRRTLSSVVTSLEREAAEREEPMAVRLVKVH